MAPGQAAQRRCTNALKKEANKWRLYLRHANVISVAVAHIR